MTSFVMFIRRLIDAFRHVRTGGKTTRRRATARAIRPAERCRTCRQPVPHSPHWEDHLDH